MSHSPTRSLMNRLAELAAVTDTPGALTRLFLSPAHAKAIPLVDGWMRKAGLQTHMDAIGNLVGRTRNSAGKPVLLLGSHIDTVRDAGAYDGNFGVLAAICAIAEIGEELPYAVEILAFGDEEGVRFPQTLSGSRAVAGTFDPASLHGTDADGITLADALQSFGGDPSGIVGIARERKQILGYVELHIEQGPVLEAENLPVGVVTAINGASRFSVTVTGAAGHAGTVPMAMRQDALVAAAAQILAIQTLATGIPDLVATVGAIAVHPGAPNSIPGRVTYKIDLRAPSDEVRKQAIADLGREIQQIAERHQVETTMTRTHDAAATQCAPWLQAQLGRAVAAQGIQPFFLPSGAGHDAMAVASLCPVGMLFVRCKGGISHTPEEFITEADADVAVAVLIRFLRQFSAEP
jgi:allantoate deiminase